MERKRKVKETISNDSEDDYISPSENTNDNSSISNDEFETAKQSHDNNHKFTIVMERIVLKMHVFKNILIKKKKQQAVNNVRSKLDDDDISSDNSELSRLKKISKHAKLNQRSFDLSINEHEVIIIIN
ncbi:hypothetical protein RhiirC2_800341 [Rhizophagus irregularis]|uniref:Uncharacterized protein n=1 Tax=Rhizophagus irregularis TaxID=588596 RepID=A0A2N1M3S8_9GLOM|nr:hypothetical protein RhiirC2_800341 [Rhizophagus irregularis]